MERIIIAMMNEILLFLMKDLLITTEIRFRVTLHLLIKIAMDLFEMSNFFLEFFFCIQFLFNASVKVGSIIKENKNYRLFKDKLSL